ncbi:enoyl-CoA hydratase-related protein [Burkholderia sp. Ac-20365]|jgi:enoyl-CoA hydratase/carnithine racemase|uniref:enoyl-CoA hydratase-related protein n=1 Tax=Burkholderia sp. Ac-20365 TaxID=2703897 RepID=UPI00197C084A|nr:enoyl-CoA hydratase-related protein [Burkholderia sp. Ac-20365]MBN3765843.1 enoyl-CoA hydratase [Burkholderia sp. Ac-20365]
MTTANITSQLDGQIWSIGIDRRAKRNALNGTMFDALANALLLAQGDVRVHCILLHGTRDCFCAGHDTAEFGSLWPQSADGAVTRCIHAFVAQPKPLVAAVNGAAVGFGATMLLHADWVVAGESAMFRFPFADLGIVPEAGATALLARRVGDLVARDWLMSGRPVTAEEALARGFVSRVVADADVRAAAGEYATYLASKPPSALQATRRLLREGATLAAAQAVDHELAYLNAYIPAVRWRSIPHA